MPIAIRNILILSVFSLLESIHGLILIVLVFNLWLPMKINPERQVFFYHGWLFLCVAIQAGVLGWFHKRLEDRLLLGRLRAFMLNETVFLFLLLFCIFKMLLWGNPPWACFLCYTVLIISWVVRLFWLKICQYAPSIYPALLHFPYPRLLDGILIVFLILLIYPLDMQACLARILIGDFFYQMDGFIMAPAWAYWSGCILNVDVICQYGIGITVTISALAKLMGALNYQNVLCAMVYMAIIYFISCYLFLRWWLKSFLLASAGIFLAIKFQMFHWGVTAFCWRYPTAMVIRYEFDMCFLFLILAHIRRRSVWTLRGACLCCGISLAYMMDTGLYQVMAFYSYLFILLLERLYLEKEPLRKQFFLLGYAVMPLIIALSVIRMLGGSAVFSKVYWHNTFEFVQLFINGFGSLPIYENILLGDYFAFFMGLFIPLVYLFSILFLAVGYILKPTRRENIFVIVLCVYGLGLYHYYVNRSAPFSYHTVDIPFVFVLMFWAREILKGVAPQLRQRILIVMFLASIGALMTNQLFTYYPNVFNIARPDWSDYKKFYSQEFHFEKEAQLIDRLTSPQQAAVLISSFDVAMLMEAKRKPFFYYFPLLHSHFMKEDKYELPYLFTYARLELTLAQMELAKPQYIFVEAKLFRGLISAQYYQRFVSLSVLMGYLHKNYDEYDQGGRLLALRRKGMS